MSYEDLLKHANEKKPADFKKEFKSQLDKTIQQKLSPDTEEEESDNGGETGDDE